MKRGRTLRLSLARRLVMDWMSFSRRTAVIALERRIHIPEVAQARLAADPKPGWYSLFLKAFGIAGTAMPELRRSLLTVPYSRLYEHPESTALIAVERELEGERAVLSYPLHRPEGKSLNEIDSELAMLRTRPLHEVKAFRRAVRVARLPRPLRHLILATGLQVRGAWRQRYFGTFMASNVAPAGADLTHGLSIHTAFLSPAAVEADGHTTLRLFVDHRVIDGATVARALVEMEAALRGPLLAELRSLARHSDSPL
ncbi:MAG: hypothetical protein U0791_16025 [Gemmataceae bacterium]